MNNTFLSIYSFILSDWDKGTKQYKTMQKQNKTEHHVFRLTPERKKFIVRHKGVIPDELDKLIDKLIIKWEGKK